MKSYLVTYKIDLINLKEFSPENGNNFIDYLKSKMSDESAHCILKNVTFFPVK